MSTKDSKSSLPQQTVDPELLFRSFLNEREITGRTALFMAVEVNRPKCLETLLAFGADPNIPNVNGVTPLQIACEKGFQTCIRVLLRNHASCLTKEANLIELIWQSIQNLDERAEMLAYLIANGAHCEVQLLDQLISQLQPSHQQTFRKAVAESSLYLQESIRIKQRAAAEATVNDSPLPQAVREMQQFAHGGKK